LLGTALEHLYLQTQFHSVMPTAPSSWANDEPTVDFHELSSESVGIPVSCRKSVMIRPLQQLPKSVTPPSAKLSCIYFSDPATLLTEMFTTANYASYRHLHKVTCARQRLEGNLILLEDTTPTKSHEEFTISQYTVAKTAEKEQHSNQEPSFTDILKQKIGNKDTDHTQNEDTDHTQNEDTDHTQMRTQITHKMRTQNIHKMRTQIIHKWGHRSYTKWGHRSYTKWGHRSYTNEDTDHTQNEDTDHTQMRTQIIHKMRTHHTQMRTHHTQMRTQIIHKMRTQIIHKTHSMTSYLQQNYKANFIITLGIFC